jgi:uncharacterized membrane protein
MKIINAILSIVSAVYYVLILLPSSLLTRGSKGRKLFQFEKKPGGTYFHERNHEYTKSDFEQG